MAATNRRSALQEAEAATIADIRACLAHALNEDVTELALERNRLHRAFVTQNPPDESDCVQLVRWYRREALYDSQR